MLSDECLICVRYIISHHNVLNDKLRILATNEAHMFSEWIGWRTPKCSLPTLPRDRYSSRCMSIELGRWDSKPVGILQYYWVVSFAVLSDSACSTPCSFPLLECFKVSSCNAAVFVLTQQITPLKFPNCSNVIRLSSLTIVRCIAVASTMSRWSRINHF